MITKAEIEIIARYMGELCGAARHDWSVAGYDEVGMDGVPIKGWRAAYFKGCKDMAEGITSRLPAEYHETMKEIAKAAFTKTFDEAQAAHAKAVAPRPSKITPQ